MLLGAIVVLGLIKEAIDAARLGWHHTSMQAKVLCACALAFEVVCRLAVRHFPLRLCCRQQFCLSRPCALSAGCCSDP